MRLGGIGGGFRLEFEGGAWSKFEEAIEGTVELPVLVDNAGRFFGIGGAGLFVGVLGTVGSTKRGDNEGPFG